ncbi:hypothetical protein GOA67_17890, partial [Sinorhizobium meliloti]|nr:hypothetical protein [Sinorhizobium meliloti]
MRPREAMPWIATGCLLRKFPRVKRGLLCADSDEAAPLFRDDCAPGFRDDLAPC